MRRVDEDDDWSDLRGYWQIRDNTTYLNHGSFGPPPQVVREARIAIQRELDAQPMDFFVRKYESAWVRARESLGRLIQAAPETLAFVENSTAAMNVIAACFPLAAGEEVLLNDHEYGAVQRIWGRRCEISAAQLRIANLPGSIQSDDEIIDCLWQHVTAETRLIVVSHITSVSAITMPVAAICRKARGQNIAVCIDGPHALAQLPLDLGTLDCDFYTASCHKWLSAPFGSGFLYVAPHWQAMIQPTRLSWGRLPPTDRPQWSDEFIWNGTRDPSAYLTVPVAIKFLETVGWQSFRARAHWLAQYARHQLVELTGLEPWVPDDPHWYTAMAHVPLPPGDARQLQNWLWQQHSIEVPVIDFAGRRFLRVSCHLYNRRSDIDRLVQALHEGLRT